jgi:hypothetical protein
MFRNEGCIFLLLLVFVTTNVGSGFAQDDIASLRRQLEELRKENSSLRDENSDLRQEIRELKARNKPGDGMDPSSKDEIVGKVWEITATGAGGKKFTGRFLAHNGNIYVDSLETPKLGTFTEKGPEVRVEIFNHKNDAANGTYKLIQISKDPPTYTGRLTNKNGLTVPVQLRMLQD